jgi:phosphatidylinositol alpha-1,6-mannosyltransferase
MKIVVVCERLAGHGGWYTYANGLVRGLKKNGHEVVTISRRDADGDHRILPSPLDVLGKPWLHLPAGSRLKKVLQSIDPDIVHFVVEPYALLAAFLPKQFQQKSIVTIHGSYGIRLLDDLMIRLQACSVFKRLSRYVTVSDYTKNAVSEMLHRACGTVTCANFSGNVRVIRNGIELPAWKPQQKKSDHKNILLVGGVKPRKGVLEALDGLAEYKRAHDARFTFIVAGTCDEKTAYVKEVKQKITALDLSENVKLVGSLSDVELERTYHDADAYLMPSPTGRNTFEGYGIAFIEANAYGVPCIGPDTGGGAEAIVEAKTGFRVDARNPKQIAERLHSILVERRIKPDDCRAWAEEHALEKRVAEMETVYAEVL